MALATRRRVPQPCSWGEPRLVRERSLDPLRQAACARALWLGTVAAAQGRSAAADPSLCQRLALPSTALHQARQALRTPGLVA
jgi:hypothetical protein